MNDTARWILTIIFLWGQISPAMAETNDAFQFFRKRPK